MSDHLKVPIEIQRKAYAKTNGICIVCGRPLSRDESKWTVDHFIPRAVYKWVPDKNTKRLIESGKNLFIVHPRCNFRKGSDLPTNDSIREMYASVSIKEGMHTIYKKAETSVAAYRSMKQSTLASQGRKCAVCGRTLGLNAAVMRRRDDEKERCRENAVCLCERCMLRACKKKRKNVRISVANREVPHKDPAASVRKDALQKDPAVPVKKVALQKDPAAPVRKDASHKDPAVPVRKETSHMQFLKGEKLLAKKRRLM